MITLGQIMSTPAFGFVFMGIIIGAPVWAVIWEIFFRDAEPKESCRPGEIY